MSWISKIISAPENAPALLLAVVTALLVWGTFRLAKLTDVLATAASRELQAARMPVVSLEWKESPLTSTSGAFPKQPQLYGHPSGCWRREDRLLPLGRRQRRG